MERKLFDTFCKHFSPARCAGFGFEKMVSATDDENFVHSTATVRHLGFPVYTHSISEYSDLLNGKATLEYTEKDGIGAHPNHFDWMSDHNLDLGSDHAEAVKNCVLCADAEQVEVFSSQKDQDIIGILMVTGNETLSIVVSLRLLEVIG